MDARDKLILDRERREAMDLELRRDVRAARDEGRSLAEIASVLRISKTRVHQLLAEEIVQKTERSTVLDGLPPGVRDLVVSGKLTPEVARQLDKLPDKKVVVALAGDAVRWNWTRMQAATAARARGADLDPEDIPSRPPDESPIVLPPAADFLVRCNGRLEVPVPEGRPKAYIRCPSVRRKSEPGLRCNLANHAGVGWSYAGPPPV